MTNSKKDSLITFVRDCRLTLSIGVLEHERQKPQPVIAHIEVESELQETFRDPADSGLSRVIDYSAIHYFLTHDIPAMGHICLLETLADLIIDYCFRDPRAQQVTVRLEKPNALPDAIGGIELCRRRKT
ncbi:MAG: dihydroneopterin aldolase [Bdellovibrionales bacterium]